MVLCAAPVCAATLVLHSPGEQLALAEHLRGLAPLPSLKAEVGQLLEVLVVAADKEDLARDLQAASRLSLKSMHGL